MPPQSAPPDLRLALVLNGGVSLAVWIGGVVHEIDRLRRSFDTSHGDTEGYREALDRRDVKSVRVDVIAGASAGGINGALLGAAIQGAKPLRGADGRSKTRSYAGHSDRWSGQKQTLEPRLFPRKVA